MRRFLLLLLLGISTSFGDDQGSLSFTVSLLEQRTQDDATNQKYAKLTSTMTCADDKCNYRVTISNPTDGYFTFSSNNKECPSSICSGTIESQGTANITVEKDGYHMDLFDFKFTGIPTVTVLGCDSGLYNENGCTRVTDTVNDPVEFWNELCVCTGGHTCTTENTGTCISGPVDWWAPGPLPTASTQQKPLYTPTTSAMTTPLPITYSVEVGVSLSEPAAGSDEYETVLVTGSMNCTTETCEYKTTVSQETQYFKIYVDSSDCTFSTCSGSFVLGETVPVVVKRSGQHLDLFDFVFRYSPTILGCTDGLSTVNTCYQISSGNDEVCSCQGKDASCKNTPVKGACDTGYTTWWLDDAPTTSLATTSAPDLNIYDLKFTLSEKGYSTDDPFNNLTINSFVNCSDLVSCTYSIQIFRFASDYYSVLVGDNECPNDYCQGVLHVGQTVPVIVYRGGEKLDLFDIVTIGAPNVRVLGCDSEMLSYGNCQKALYTDENVNMQDSLCMCRSTEEDCNDATPQGLCNTGSPAWWKPEYSTTPTPSTELSFNVNLTEDVGSGNESSNKVVVAEVYEQCQSGACYYRIKFTFTNPGYFTVLVNDKECDANVCESSFLQSEQVVATVKRRGEILDWFVLKYGNASILGCSKGFIIDEQCAKIQYYSTEKNVNDMVCSCRNNGDGCGAPMSDAHCDEGAVVWWRADPNYSTTLPTTTEPPVKMKTFTVSLSEEIDDRKELTYNLTIAGSINCTLTECEYEAEIINEAPTYYTILLDGMSCSSPCKGVIHKGPNNATFSVHRYQQHLDLVVFSFTEEPQVLIAGCETMENEFILLLNHEVNENVCSHVLHETGDSQMALSDNLCVCQGLGETCGQHTPIGTCTHGDLTWWVDDPGRTTPKSRTTTTEDRRNSFQFFLHFNETSETDKRLRKLDVYTSMGCSPEECDYYIDAGDYDLNYFTVAVGLKVCLPTCEGSFMKGKAVNVTVFRGDQKLDLFDLEYTDVPNIVVLGCEDGLVEYGECFAIRQTVSDGHNQFHDEVCSCRSAGLETCSEHGVCRSGTVKWWEDVDDSTSTSPVPTTTPLITTVSTTPDYIIPLKNLSDSTIGINNVTQILNDTLSYSKEGQNLTGTQIFEISKVLHKSANVPGISADNAMQILTNMDSCLNANEQQLRQGHSKEFNLLGVLQPMVHNTVDNIIQYLHGKNMGFGAKKVDCSSIDSDDGLIDYGPDVGFAALNDTNRLSATEQNSIIVPLKRVCQDNEAITHVFFTIYRHQKLFVGNQRYRTFGGPISDPKNGDDEDSREGFRVKRDTNENDTSLPYPPPSKCEEQVSVPHETPVLSATLMNNGAEVSRLRRDAEQPIVAELQFNIGKMMRPLHGNYIVSWFNPGTQVWETREQCKVTSIKDGIVTATCEHLTDFSALVYGQLNAQFVCSTPLIIIGYVVNSVSVACLAFLITISLMFYIHIANVSRILTFIRGQIPTKGDIINLAYYTVFLMFFILLIGFMDQSIGEADSGTTSTYCIVIAAMSYFSLLSAILLSMLIGIRMVSHFFPPKLRVFFGVMTSAPAALSIGVVIPLTLTVILAVFETNFFKRDDSFCWVRPDYVVYAVIIPITIPIINGLICSTFAIYKMFFQAKRGLANKETSHHDAEFWSKVFGLVIMQVAMGLPWGVEFIIIGISGKSPWNYVFVILLGTQGIDLFLIFLYRRHRLVNESKKWSAREQRFGRNSKERRRVETFMD